LSRAIFDERARRGGGRLPRAPAACRAYFPTTQGAVVVRILRGFLAAALCLALASGCGRGGRLNTAGRIVKGGAPYTVPQEEYVRVTFFPVTSDGKPPQNTYIATYNGADGTFRAVGPDGKGIPAGKYRIALEHLRQKKDVFNGAYDGNKSPFVFDVDPNTTELVINLDQKT
jgi:hypothetical protein